MVFQQFNVWPHLNVLENVIKAQIVVAKRSREVAEPKALKILSDVGLKDKLDEWPENLSGGQKQRISLARAMATSCDLLILDNVLSAVDYETERYLLQQIFARRQAKSLLIVSHRVTAVEKADWILVLDEGRIVAQGTHEKLLQQPGYYQEMWALQHETS